jgi:hypothetical protein
MVVDVMNICSFAREHVSRKRCASALSTHGPVSGAIRTAPFLIGSFHAFLYLNISMMLAVDIVSYMYLWYTVRGGERHG